MSKHYEVNTNECLYLGLDPEKVNAVARRLARVAADAEKLGLTIFGGSTHGSLRKSDSVGYVIAADIIAGHWDGGDGGEGRCMPDGIKRGEY